MRDYLRRFRRYFSDGGAAASEVDAETGHATSGNETEDEASGAKSPTSQQCTSSSVFESTTDEDNSARLSRRSSVLVDLLALFRRSSSYARRPSGRHKSTWLPDNLDVEDSDEDEEQARTISRDKVLEAIKQKKEIIQKLRCQPWNMKRKRRTLKVAQRHLQRQEAKVSKWHLYKVEAGRRLTQFFRWMDNVKIYLIPWESKIKRIESHFGSVVSSYFTFLRWVLSVNIIMSIVVMLFVVIPEWLADSRDDPVRFNRTHHIKIMPEKVRMHADEITTIWDFGGYLQYSLLFYGYYSSETYFGETVQYRVPIAYFFVNLFLLGYSFFTILRKMAANARTSKLAGGKAEQYVFSWKAFTGWDFSIGNPETSSSLFMANVNKMREAIAEYNVKIKKKFAPVLIAGRVTANFIILTMLGLSVWAILEVGQITEKDTFIKQNAVSITISFITLIFPNIFELIGKMERYHPRFALRIQLARVLCLYIVNYYTLIVSLMFMLNTLESEMRAKELSEFTHYYDLNSNSYHFENAAHPKNGTFYSVYDPNVTYRHARQVDTTLLNGTSIYPYYVVYPPPPSTTPAVPTRPWTTVFPNFGPISIHNPKALVISNPKKISLDDTAYETVPVGPKGDWSPVAVRTTQGPVTLNFTGSPSRVSQPYRATNYDDLCWETLIGQEITKIVTVDLVMTIAAIFAIDFFRGLWVRYCNIWWCWNLETTFPEYGEFKVAENVLHLVNNQGMIWLGLFFVPMLPAINNIKLVILMYIRGWAVMTCNVPARQIFRASRSSNFYLMLLLLMLFLCTLPVGYVIASKKPSKNCGPFGNQERFYSIISEVLRNNLNKNLVEVINYMSSPGIIIPVMVLLLLIIYFLFALVRGLKEANSDLSNQLMQERTEEKKKIFELAGGRKKHYNGGLVITKTPKPPPPPTKTKSKISHSYNSSDDDSPSKSLVSLPRSNQGRHFVPSLGSVNEADVDEDEDASQRLLEDEEQREPSEPPPKFTWKQKFLICIGLEDPRRLRERASRRNTRQDTGEGMEMDEMLEEESNSEEEDQNSEFITDEQSSFADEQYSDYQTTDEKQRSRAPSRSSYRDGSAPNGRNERSSSRQSGRIHGAQSDTEAMKQKNRPSTLYLPSGNFLVPPSTRRAASSYMNKPSSASSIEHEIASESSPLHEKHHKRHPNEGKLIPAKRSPLPLRSEKAQQQYPAHPTGFIKNIIEDDEEIDSVQILISSSTEAGLPTVIDHAERLQMSDWGSHGQSTRPPSGDPSLGEPTPSTSFVDQTTELGLADPRIVYSNPYAAAMCSPIMTDGLNGRNGKGGGYKPLLCQVAEVHHEQEGSLPRTPQIQRRDPTLPPVSPTSPRSRTSEASSGNRTISSGTGGPNTKSPVSPSSPTEISRPRFRISMSPTAARRTVSETNATGSVASDPNARQFVLRVNGKNPPKITPGSTTNTARSPRQAHRSQSQQTTV